MIRQTSVFFVLLTTTMGASAVGQEWIQNDIDRSVGIREFQKRFNSPSEYSRESFTEELIQRWLNDEHPMRIIGAIEGKTGVRAPDGWNAAVVLKLGLRGPVRNKFIQQGVLSADSDKEGFVAFYGIKRPRLVEDDVFPLGIKRQKTVRLVHRTSSWSIETDGWRLKTKPFSEWKASGTRHWQINVSQSTPPIVALNDGYCSAFHIRSFETATSKQQWVAPVWGLLPKRPGVYIGGTPLHAVWIEASETAIVVFGFEANSNNLYAEAFDAKSGKAIFRFSPDWNEGYQVE